MLENSEKLAVITGGSRGIGAATARRLAADGYQILLTYASDSQSAERVIAEIRNSGVDCFAVKVDCSEPDEVFVLGQHPWCKSGIDVLVLNHAMYQRSRASELTSEALNRTMSVNFTGSFLVWEALSQHLVDDARIIVIGSQLGVKGTATGADYAASKAALHAWARSLALDVAKSGQRVNVVAPGTIDTDIVSSDSKEQRLTREQNIPLGRLGNPSEIAGVVSFLAGPDSSYLIGSVLHVNGGLFRP